MKNEKNELIIWSKFKPYSLDPLDFDYDVHHLIFRSVFSSLVSNYKAGEIVPQLASSWSSSSDLTEWRFELRSDKKFSNNEYITSQDVLSSFKRAAFVMKNKKSESGMFEYLVGYEKIKNMSSEIEGLHLDGNKLILKFTKPIPDLLEKISFGLYGIAHSSDFDSITGEWKDSKKGITSGQYQVSSWDPDKVILKNNIDSKVKNFSFIKFHFSNNLNEINNSDIVIFDNKNPYIKKNEWDFVTKTQANSIIYIQVMNWDDPKNYFSIKENRIKFRDLYYEYLENEGYKVTRSFFPLGINNVLELPPSSSKSKLGTFDSHLRTQHFIYNAEYEKIGIIERGSYFSKALSTMGIKNSFSITHNEYPEKREDEKKVFDIQFLGTTILINSPLEDIKFMFKSGHGIKLPDEDGSINKLLSETEIDIQKINQKMWEQGLIWPVTHSTEGMWVNKKTKINYDELNLSIHPLDAQFIFKD